MATRQRDQPLPETWVGDVHHPGGGQRDRPPAAADVGHVVGSHGVAALAGRQGGAVGRAQLVALGVGRRTIDHWLRTERLLPVHRGVYAVGHASLTTRGRAVAALLAGGDAAVLSHRSAAADWRVLPEPATPEITLLHGRARSRPGLVVHRSGTLAAGDVRERAGLRVTALERTLLDLAAVEPAASLERAVAEAQVLRLVAPASVRAVAARTPGHHGIAALLAALDGPSAAATRSELERAMLRLVRAAGLPRPDVDRRIAGHTADFSWPEHRLIAETDGWHAHGHRLAFERDRARDAAHLLAGWTVVRFTWRQITEEPLRVAAQLAALLSRADPAGRRSAA